MKTKTQTTNIDWTDNDGKKMKIWNSIDKIIAERDDLIIKKDWHKVAKLYIKLAILIYRNLK